MSSKKIGLAALGALVIVAIGLTVIYRPAENMQSVAIFNLVSHPILDASVNGIKLELAERGYDETNVRFLEVNANGQMELLNAFAEELLASRPDVIIPVSTPVTQAVIAVAQPEQAIVYSTVTNPDDLAISERRNITGVSDSVNYEANIDLIQELFPNAKRIGVIYNAGERNSQYGVERVKEIVSKRELTLVFASVSGTGEVNDAALSLSGEVDVFYIGSDNTVVSALQSVISVAKQNRIPVIASDVGSVELGALAAVSVNYEQVGREAGRIVAEILGKGVSASSIPHVFKLGNTLVINEQAAKSIGFSFPENIYTRSTRIVD